MPASRSVHHHLMSLRATFIYLSFASWWSFLLQFVWPLLMAFIVDWRFMMMRRSCSSSSNSYFSGFQLPMSFWRRRQVAIFSIKPKFVCHVGCFFKYIFIQYVLVGWDDQEKELIKSHPSLTFNFTGVIWFYWLRQLHTELRLYRNSFDFRRCLPSLEMTKSLLETHTALIAVI